MRVPGFSTRIFFYIIAACILVQTVYSVSNRITFERDFLGYLNDQGVQRMHEFIPRIQEVYSQHGNWDFLPASSPSWIKLMRPERRNDNGNEPPYTPPISDQTGAVLRFALLDPQNKLLFGNPGASNSNSIRLPIEVENQTVGWIAMVPFQTAAADGDERFYQAQIYAFWANGVFSVFVAALLAWFFSRALTRKVRSLANNVHHLAAGDYAQRITYTGHDELATLAADVNLLAQTLEKTEHARRVFMADISHEFRTPLAVLRAEIEAIQDGIRPMNIQTLKPLQTEIQQLGKLIDDFHDLAVTEAGEFSFHFNTVDLACVLRYTIEGMQGRFENAQLKLEFVPPANSAPMLIQGDELRLHQLFLNLLENSLRYTAAAGAVRIQIQDVGQQLVVFMDDTAPGVTPDCRTHLFERFFRVEPSRNRSSGGSGLGLAICHNIVQAHKGSIHADASPIGGLRIVIQFPLESA